MTAGCVGAVRPADSAGRVQGYDTHDDVEAWRNAGPGRAVAVRPVTHDGHDHHHGPGGHHHGGVDVAILTSRDALGTLWRSLIILGLTAALQLVVVSLSGSVALLADAVHNVGDALTAVPLAAAFLLGRRPPTRRLTYGYGRTEDLAGLVVLAIILFSAVYAAYAAIERIIHPERPGLLWAVAAARCGSGRRQPTHSR